MPERSSSPEVCIELLAHPSMDSPIVIFVLNSSFYSKKYKVQFESLRLRSAGATLAAAGENFGVGKSRGGQYVYRGLFQLHRLFEFDAQYRTTCDLVGPLSPFTGFFVDGLQTWLKNREIETWEQLANSTTEGSAALAPQKRSALGGFVTGLSAAVLQSGLPVGPVLQQLTNRFAYDANE